MQRWLAVSFPTTGPPREERMWRDPNTPQRLITCISETQTEATKHQEQTSQDFVYAWLTTSRSETIKGRGENLRRFVMARGVAYPGTKSIFLFLTRGCNRLFPRSSNFKRGGERNGWLAQPRLREGLSRIWSIVSVTAWPRSRTALCSRHR